MSAASPGSGDAARRSPEAPHARGPSYVRCRNCGRYIATSALIDGRWCSSECSRSYDRCVTCGGWFQRGSGFGGEHCSALCATRYVIQRRYGPQPVLLIPEA